MKLFFNLFILFGVFDTICYCLAKYPERTFHWYYKLVGGGIVALIKFGKD